MSRGGEQVLEGLNLTLPAGEITTLVGESGSGKTTLVKLILRLVSPDEGSVKIGECDVWSASPDQTREVWRNLSALHAGSTVYEGSVFASLTIRQHLLASLYEKNVNRSRAAGGAPRGLGATNPYLRAWTFQRVERPASVELAERAQAWLERFGLVKVADLLPHQVAPGLRRRVALASVLAVEVPLYVLDGPEGAFDAIDRGRIESAIGQVHACTGATMLIVTHDLDLAEALSDQLAVLASGRIVYSGQPQPALEWIRRWGYESVAQNCG